MISFLLGCVFPGLSEATTMLFLTAGSKGTQSLLCKGKVSRSVYVSLHSKKPAEGRQEMHRTYPQATSPICLEFKITFFFDSHPSNSTSLEACKALLVTEQCFSFLLYILRATFLDIFSFLTYRTLIFIFRLRIQFITKQTCFSVSVFILVASFETLDNLCHHPACSSTAYYI